jgi:metal-responsive CopG/Arc/MetJ family transcriptional regulator
MARFNITLPDSIAKKLDEDAENQGIARSTLIAQYIERHYEGKSEDDIEAEITRLRAESADIIQRARREHEKAVEILIADHETELQQLRAGFEKQIEQIAADNAVVIQQLEGDVERLETISEKYKNDLKSSEERNAVTAEELRQSEASKNAVVIDLQHENKLLQLKVAHLETLLQTERRLASQLHRDRQVTQRQLELITAGLHSHKASFWTRLSGGSRKRENRDYVVMFEPLPGKATKKR